MLSVSLHKIKITAPVGLYQQEHLLENTFEVDVDIYLSDSRPWPFVDYVIIRQIVADRFEKVGLLLETLATDIHQACKEQFPMATSVRIAIRKLHPPMPGEAGYAQVVYEA